MKLTALMMVGALVLGSGMSGDVLAHGKDRSHGKGDVQSHTIHRHKHIHHYYKPSRHTDRRHSERYADRRHGNRHEYRPYRYRYEDRHYSRGKKHPRDSWYGIHLFLGGY